MAGKKVKAALNLRVTKASPGKIGYKVLIADNHIEAG
jgi:hypothetical protein